MKHRYRFVEIQEPGKPSKWRTQKWSWLYWHWFSLTDGAFFHERYQNDKEEAWRLYVNLLTETKITVIHDTGKHADAQALDALNIDFPNIKK